MRSKKWVIKYVVPADRAWNAKFPASVLYRLAEPFVRSAKFIKKAKRTSDWARLPDIRAHRLKLLKFDSRDAAKAFMTGEFMTDGIASPSDWFKVVRSPR